jgi:HEAT repeat protein
MNVFIRRRSFVVGSGLVLALLVPSIGSPDDVTLQNGGVLRGKVTKSGKLVAVTTSRGTRIVVEQSTVRKIGRDSSAAAAAGKIKLTEGQKAWFGKLRKLVRRVESENRDSSAQALRELRAIHDPDALPALTQTLRTSDQDASRVLYVRILGDMPGSTAVVGLVEEALFDSSPIVRDAAQAASKRQRPDFVRPFYGQALRFPNREVVNRAANVLATVGNKENVPYLIDSLYSRTVDIVLRPSCCMSRITYLALPDHLSNGSRYMPPSNLIAQTDGTYTSDQEHYVAQRVVRMVENPPVKEALEAITKQSFGYNTSAWRHWWKSTQLADSSGGR